MEVLPSEQIEKLHVTADFIEYKTAADSSPQLVPTSEIDELDNADDAGEEPVEAVVDAPVEEPVDDQADEPMDEHTDEPVSESVEDEALEDTTEDLDTEASNSTINDDTKKVTNEETSSSSLPSSVKTNKSRELKSILALSKEAKLDTNIAHKRESRKIELPTGLKPNSESRSSSTGSNSDQVTPKHKTNVDYFSNYAKFIGNSRNDESDSEDKQKKSNASSPSMKKSKRKRISSLDSPGGDSSGEDEKKVNKIHRIDFKKSPTNGDRDKYCWHCHRDGAWIFCKTCPRSYHQKCLKHTVPEHWHCPECAAILKAESTKTRSVAMKHMTLEHLCGLLKFALKRMMQYTGSEPFLHPVNKKQFPDYNDYVAHPMDLTRLQNNIRDNLYGSTEAFLADAKWILHNSIIFNSYQSKLTSIAKGIFKICKQEMSEIETCAECYLNANTKKETWFIEVCSKPHMLLWAKLKGFPYWPAKAMCTNSTGLVDVRFFGAHDRAWVPIKECFLYSQKDPNSNKQKRNDIAECVKELELHLDKIREKYGSFNHAPYRMPYEPESEEQQLKMLIPSYPRVSGRRQPSAISVKIDYSSSASNELSSPAKQSNASVASSPSSANYATTKVSAHEFDKFVEGYGTDADDLEAKIDMENRKHRKARQETEEASSGDDEDEEYDNSADSEKKEDDASKENDDFDTQVDPNTKADDKDCSFSPTVPSKPRHERESRKRISSSDEFQTSPPKLSRRNSDQSVQSDSSRLSNISERINKLDVPEDVEISLGNAEKPGRISASDWLMMKMSQATKNDEKSDDKPDHSAMEEASTSETDASDMEQHTRTKSAQEESATEELDSTDKSDQKPDSPGNEASGARTVKTYGRKSSRTEPQTEESGTKNSQESAKTERSKETPATSAESTPPSKRKSTDSKKTEANVTQKLVENGNLPEKDKAAPQQREKAAEAHDKQTTPNAKKSEKTTPKRLALFEDFGDVDSTSDAVNALPQSGENPEEAAKENGTIHLAAAKSVLKHFAAHKEKRSEATPKATETIKIGAVLNSIVKKSTKHKEISVTRTKLNSEVDLVKKNSTTSKGTVKIVDVSEIINAKGGKGGEVAAAAAAAVVAPEDVHIKTESESDETDESDGEVDSAYMEAKKRYLSALNISLKSDVERTKLNAQAKTNAKGGLATRSRTKEDSVTRAIENKETAATEATTVAVVPSNRQMLLKKKPPFQNLKEITIKPLSSMQQVTGTGTPHAKQKARKSFPSSPSSTTSLLNNKQLSLTVKKPTTVADKTAAEIRLNEENRNGLTITQSSTSSLIVSAPDISPATHSATQPPPLVRSNASKAPTWILPQPSSLQQAQPVHQFHTSGGQILTMVQHPVHLQPQQNRAPNAIQVFPGQASQCAIVNGPTPLQSGGAAPAEQQIVAPPAALVGEELSLLRSVVPENLSRAVSELMCRAPPKLKPRPPGPLSATYDEGISSSAGPVAQHVNAVAHRFADYFRGLIIETVKDLGSCTDNAEAQITSLRRENEELKHRHAEEILEIKKNVSSVLRDIQKSIMDERTKLIEDTRGTCEAETIRRVEEAKSKQWCANCFKEAQFYCCWNTSYCDYPCQQKHWGKHMKTCSQNNANSSNSASATSSPKTPSSIVLRPTTAPKQLQNKTFLGKPTKVMVTRPGISNKPIGVLSVAKPPGTAGGQHTITLLESTPGNFEILGNHGPISVGGKLITSSSIIGKIKPGKMITVNSPSNSSQQTAKTSSSSNKLLTPVAANADKSQSIVIDDDDK